MSKLPELSQIDLAMVDSYERKNDNGTTVLSRVTTSGSCEPSPGHDELTVCGIVAVLDEGDEQCAEDVVAYERPRGPRRGIRERGARDR